MFEAMKSLKREAHDLFSDYTFCRQMAFHINIMDISTLITFTLKICLPLEWFIMLSVMGIALFGWRINNVISENIFKSVELNYLRFPKVM